MREVFGHRRETHISIMMSHEGMLMSRAILVSHELLVRETFKLIVTQRLESQTSCTMKGLKHGMAQMSDKQAVCGPLHRVAVGEMVIVLSLAIMEQE